MINEMFVLACCFLSGRGRWESSDGKRGNIDVDTNTDNSQRPKGNR
jgi:hypothetical protein